jgi:glutathione S-transferase
MSNAKRDQSEFHQTLAVGHAPLRSGPGSAGRRPTLAPARRGAVAWGNGAATGSDPYNAVGARAAPGQGQRA